jgi:hypothetical protein
MHQLLIYIGYHCWLYKPGNVSVVQRVPALHEVERSDAHNSLNLLFIFHNNKFRTNIYISFSIIYYA